MKVGDLVYTKNVGYPFDRTDDGHESWEGVSCVVTAMNAGWSKDMIEVTALFPIKCGHGHTPMTSCLFHAHQVKPEDRPWLKKRLKDIMRLKNVLRKAALEAEEINEEFGTLV